MLKKIEARRLLMVFMIFSSLCTLLSCSIDFSPINPTAPTASKPVESTEPNNEYQVIVENVKDVAIEIDETYTFRYIMNAHEGLQVSSMDESIITVNDGILTGVKTGETNILLEKDGFKQLVSARVYDKGELSSTFSFDKERLSGKKIVAFGDSVTANATIGGGRTYFDNFILHNKMLRGTNYAIGGTTGTYMYEGSNIYKEYAQALSVLDGVRVVKKAYDAGELASVDYAFIAYGHNDQYFQPPIEAVGDDTYDVSSFDSCHSFKGSYRYMINTLRLANPNVRIILLNCTYSEYDKANPSLYGNKYSYADYRNAISELAVEMNLTHIDPWEYLKSYFDAYDSNVYYKDSVHLSEKGHLLLGAFICNYREQ